MALRADLEPGDNLTLRLLENLGTAWATFALYPDPTGQPAFVRAAESLAELFVPPIVVGVGPGTFLRGEEEFDIRRDGTERLARELFLHDAEFLRLKGGTSAEDLVTFFETIDTDDEEVRELGGISAVMQGHGDIGIEVFERGLLVVSTSQEVDDTDPTVVAMLLDTEGLSEAALAATRGADPDEVARILRSEARAGKGDGDGDGDPVVQAFLSGLNELHERAAPYAGTAGNITGALREGASDPWKGFRTFLEAFFYMPRPAQLMVLESILAESDSVPRQLFLDQLSGADLADYVPLLSEGGKDALVAYTIVVSSEAGRPDETVSVLTASRDVASARQAVATRISEVLRSGAEDRPAAEGLVTTLREQMSQDIDEFSLGVGVFRGLLQAEEREGRFARVLRVWTGRVSRYLRDGDWETGERLLSTVLSDPPYVAEKEADVREAVSRIAGRETIRLILDQEFGAQPSDRALRLIEAMGTAVVGPLVEMLANEEDGQARRLLTELLARAVRSDPRTLDVYLAGQPWFVQRNLATVLAKTGRTGALPSLRQLIHHDDHRVRVEALRGIVRIERADAAPFLVKMLEDPHERVRQNAATLARSSESPDLDRLLARELQEDRLAPDVAVAIVRILAARPSSEARAVVEELAKQRFALKGGSRAVRDAAREALQGGRR